MLLADFGTTYSKTIDTTAGSGPRLQPSREVVRDLQVDIATGHNGKKFANNYVNELTALARGGAALIDGADYTLLDCGSRDIKYIRVNSKKVIDMGWNAECGASMGFTIELLSKYYNIDYSKLSLPDRAFSITCGVLGMSSIFDAVVNGEDETVAVARFVKGIALNAYRFAGSPETLYLSGGLCLNPLFVQSFPCKVITLGRYVLLKGLEESIQYLD